MSIRRKGRGWEVRVTIAGRSVGRTVRGPKAAAHRWELAARQALERGAAPAQRRIEDAILRWIDGEARALKSFPNLEDKARQWLPWATLPLEAMPEAAEQATAQWLAEGKKPATINRRLALLRRVANLAYRWQWIEHPLGPRIISVPGERPRYVQATVDQARLLIESCAHTATRDLVSLALLTGLRKGELLGLTQAHIQPGRILLDANNKTGRPRVVPLTPEAAAIAARAPFTIAAQTLRDDWEQARIAAGLPGLRWTDLRRTFGSWIVQNTGNLKAAQDLLGHTTSQITSRHYAHLLDRNLVAAVGTLPRVGKILGKQTRPTKKKAA